MGLGADISQWGKTVDWENPDFVRAWNIAGGEATKTENGTAIKTPDGAFYSIFY